MEPTNPEEHFREARYSEQVMASNGVAGRAVPDEPCDDGCPPHWVGDLVVGINARSAIVTLVERTTRSVVLLQLPDGHSADAVRDLMIPTIRTLREHLRRSLTCDQDTELGRRTPAEAVQQLRSDP
ncbi:hypothetical protein [Curtobacterium sp. RRHDQ10]|uniref:hypothetical protein n=1 Tax=Curtobacterium phyllosphaerae TaxID=3413379 RepID=UPI003BF20022